MALKSLSLRELIPDDQSYVTYEGSLTMPSCDEVVTWVVINKVCISTKQHLSNLKKRVPLCQTELKQTVRKS